MERIVTTTLALLTVATGSTLVADVPPHFAATELGALQGGSTQVYALNDAGLSTGESGTNQISIGYHAFLGQPDGSIENIETVLGYDISEGRAINNSGQVAGTLTYFPSQYGVSSIFRYTPGVGMVDIGTLGGTNGSIAGVNQSGDVAGSWDTAADETHAFLYTDAAGLQDLGTWGTYESNARAINDSREIVGYAWTADWHYHAFLWDDGLMQDLGTLGGNSSTAYYISNTGVVVGDAQMADGTWHAFRYTAAGGMEPVPAPPGTTSSGADFVTESGMIVGWWNDAEFRRHAFCYTDQQGALDLGVDVGNTAWTGPVAVNEAGQILLAVMDSQTYEVRAFLFDPETGLYDLNDLLVSPLNWVINEAAGINESGQIVASGFSINHYASVLLTPVEPGDLDGDGTVDLSDLAALLAHYGVTSGAMYADGDIDADGDVDLSDLAVLLAAY